MAREADEMLTEDMSESELAAGLEEALGDDLDETEEGAPEPGDGDEQLDDDEDDLDEDEEDDLDDDDLDDEEGEDGEEGATDAGAEKKPAAKAGEEAQAEPITREDGAVWNPEAKRWSKDGKFVEGAAPEAKPAVGAATATKTEATPWEPLAIRVDRTSVPIKDARISKSNGHHFIAIPDDKFVDFQRQLGKGVQAERLWRQLDQGIKDLEAEREEAKNRPAIRSDSEVEADIFMEAIKDRLPELFEKHELDNLELRVQLAQRDEKDKLAQHETERRTRTTESATHEQTVKTGIANTLVEIVEDPQYAAEFADLTEGQLRDVMNELLAIQRAVFWKEGNGYMRNTQLVYDRLKQKAGSKTAPAATAPTKDATPAKAGTTAEPSTTAATRAERLNKGHDTAAKPKTTSLKAGRGETTRPSGKEHHRGTRRTKQRSREQRSEDALRAQTRSYLKSPGLDFPGE